MWVKRSLSVVNFKQRIASFAWRASSSTIALCTYPSCIQHCLPLNAWHASRPTCRARASQLCVLRWRAITCATTLRVTTGSAPSTSPTGGAKKSMACSPMRGLINHGSRSKHKFLQKALPPQLPWLAIAHLCSLTHALPPLSHNLCSYYHPLTCSFEVYSSFLFSSGSGLGVRDPRPRIGIVICPLFPFWRAGRPVWKHSTGGSSIIFALMARICLSCFIAPALACGLSSERALRRRPSSNFPFCLILALPACV